MSICTNTYHFYSVQSEIPRVSPRELEALTNSTLAVDFAVFEREDVSDSTAEEGLHRAVRCARKHQKTGEHTCTVLDLNVTITQKTPLSLQPSLLHSTCNSLNLFQNIFMSCIVISFFFVIRLSTAAMCKRGFRRSANAFR